MEKSQVKGIERSPGGGSISLYAEICVLFMKEEQFCRFLCRDKQRVMGLVFEPRSIFPVGHIYKSRKRLMKYEK